MEGGLAEDSTLLSFLRDLHDKIKSFSENFKGFGEIFKNVGKLIVKGLIDGIGSQISALVNKVKEMASKASNSVKNAFGIRSPSKLMMKYGEQVVQGFNQGIQTMGGIGVQVPALAPASASASRPMATGATGAGSGGALVHIENLTVPPGTTQEQVRFLMQAMGKEVKRQGGIG
jgi:hypothetical protein